MTPVIGEILDQESIAQVRRGRTVSASVSAHEVIGTPIADEPEPLRPLDPHEAHQRGVDMVLKGFLDDPIRFGLLCDMVRLQHPEMRLFGDDQLVTIVRALYDEAVRTATDEAFRKLGREKELQIKTEGF